MHNNGVNISEPTEEKKILDELVDQKQQLIKNITTSLRQIDQVMESNLIEKFETQRGNASIGGLEYLQAILGLFA
ncbi:MAG: hypothetical protein LBG52_05560 [Candidatus Peribacteria bacterium]|jgi:hypothetical protein|nr:hypothetical protein [Candidatus Peribacteria bacterium]